jgi:hypothetical protein
MPISFNALLSAQAQATGEVWLTLLTFSHPSLAAPLRLASPRAEPLSSQGATFLPAFFDALLPSDQFDTINTFTVTVNGVDGVLLRALQGLFPRATMTIQVVLASDPNTVLYEAPDFEVSKIKQEGLVAIAVELEPPPFLTLAFPGKNLDRANFPGLFTNIG